MNVFSLRSTLVRDYERFARSFTTIRASDIREQVDALYASGRYWPEPLLQVNPKFETAQAVDELATSGAVHPEMARIFRVEADTPLRLHRHQAEALALGQRGESFVVTTGTGSGKSLCFFLPIFDGILKAKDVDPAPRTRAIIIYPMNALANSQSEELQKFLRRITPQPVTFARYTGQESDAERRRIADNPPDILLTNFMMLELLMTRQDELDKRVIANCQGLGYLVLDELHTYRGRQGADVAMLVRRVRERVALPDLVCIGTSATMASEGSASEKKATVARVASKIFATAIPATRVVQETLRRVTDDRHNGVTIRPHLAAAIRGPLPTTATDDDLKAHPLAIWVENVLGLDDRPGERKVRARPLTLEEAIDRLAEDSGLSQSECGDALEKFLLLAAQSERDRTNGASASTAPFFAFKLHQFLSGAGTVYTTLETPGTRTVELDAQPLLPGHPDKRLFAAHFCRTCGHEYHPVRRRGDAFLPRSIDDGPIRKRANDDDDTGEDGNHELLGFLTLDPGATDPDFRFTGEDHEYPEDWTQERKDGSRRLKSTFAKHRAVGVRVLADGVEGADGAPGWFIPGKFRFCVSCRTTWGAQGKDFTRLASLSAEGRSSATTVLTASVLRWMHDAGGLKPISRKLLGFVDNRQDAALQAGHFNDFVNVALVRGAFLLAARKAGSEGLALDQVGSELEKALGFDKEPEAGKDPHDTHLANWLKDPTVAVSRRQEAREVIRWVLAYRVWLEQRRSWRYTNPSLDRLGLVRTVYRGLRELVNDDARMAAAPGTLPSAKPDTREAVICTLLDYMREGSAIDTAQFDQTTFERQRDRGEPLLHTTWAIGRDERVRSAAWFTVDAPQVTARDAGAVVRGGFTSVLGRKLRSSTLWNDAHGTALNRDRYDAVVKDLLEFLRKQGLVAKSPGSVYRVTGWRIAPEVVRYVAGEARDDANRYFTELYGTIAAQLSNADAPLFGFEAREHTAQVKADKRELREQRFRFQDADKAAMAANPTAAGGEEPTSFLPVLFCSPTMELGVDISALNAVYLRNVPPTPANYAQRSGRAGRSGMAALVVTYCAARSPHDQYFFRDPRGMVHGEVRPPLLDLANHDLVRSHLHAVWLAASGHGLPGGIAQVLDLSTEGNLAVQPDHRDPLASDATRQEASQRTSRVLAMLTEYLTPTDAPWYPGPELFTQAVVAEAGEEFDRAFDRWRSLYRSALEQHAQAGRVITDATSTREQMKQAQQDQAMATALLAALRDATEGSSGDFNLYRYLATEGFLPGYNFPRLPVLACIPGNRDKEQAYVQRPRFLALSEFGPRALLYHEGRTYRVVKVRLGGRSEGVSERSGELPVLEVRVCKRCGAGHLARHENGCHACGEPLGDSRLIKGLYRIEHVDTRPTQRITADDEDRQRQGFELVTTFRWPIREGRPAVQTVVAADEEGDILTLQYGSSATITRINLGLRRRRNRNEFGYDINPNTGWWGKGLDEDQDDGNAPPTAPRSQKIVPFVEDQKNALHLRFAETNGLDDSTRATLQHALRRAIEVVYQLEEGELLVEPLPDRDLRSGLLFYEAAEGGAGVLTRLAHEPDAIARVAYEALRVLHLDLPEWSPEARGALPREVTGLADTDRPCVKSCYRCLLSYYNQPDHEVVDRRDASARRILLRLSRISTRMAEPPAREGEVEEPVAGATGWLGRWSAAAQASGFVLPGWTVAGEATAQWPDRYAAIVLPDTPPELKQRLENAGMTLFPFTEDVSLWPAGFARLARYLGVAA